MNGKSTDRKNDDKLSKTNIANRKRAHMDYGGFAPNVTRGEFINFGVLCNFGEDVGINPTLGDTICFE
jgi:hypothetical protein